MLRLALTLLLLFSTSVPAQELHTFSNGEVADAEKINENFELLRHMTAGAQTSVEANCTEDPDAFASSWVDKSSFKNISFNVIGDCVVTDEVQRDLNALQGRFVRIQGRLDEDRLCSSSLNWAPSPANELKVSRGKLALSCLSLKGVSDLDEPVTFGLSAQEFGEIALSRVSAQRFGNFQATDYGIIDAFISAETMGYVVALNNSTAAVVCENETQIDWRSIQVFSWSTVTVINCNASGLDSLYSEEGGRAVLNSVDLEVKYVNVSSSSQLQIAGSNVSALNQLAVRDNSFMEINSGTSISAPKTIVQRGGKMTLGSRSVLQSEELSVTLGSGVFWSATSGAMLLAENISEDTTSYVSSTYP